MYSPRRFLPFPVTELSAGDFAALPSRYQFPFAAPLSQICKWFWLAKQVTMTWSAEWSSVLPGSFGGTFTGHDAVSGTLDLFINTNVGLPASMQPPLMRLSPLPVSPHVCAVAPILPSGSWDVGAYSALVDGSVVGGVNFEMFAGDYTAAHQPYVVKCGGLFYPAINLAISMFGLTELNFFPPDYYNPSFPEGAGYVGSNSPTSGPGIGTCLFEGFSIPMYGAAFGAAGSSLSASLQLALVNDYWPV